MPFIKFGLIALIVAFLAFKFLNRPNSPLPTLNLKLGADYFTLEIAKSALEQSRGLSGRPNLCPTCGMIFIFSNLAPRYFWMKNTLIPLDMLFLDQNGVINTIHTAVPEPNTSDLKLKIYSSLAPAKYVIEIPSGRAQELGLKIGSQINLESITK